MDLTLLFISSGLFLGWSLGANDAANVFGTAVGAKVIRFRSAAIIMSIFVIIGAVSSGAGASHTLGKLGSIDSLPGAFMVALSSAIVILVMTKYGLPVSTSQAIVGSIIGWNLYTGTPTRLDTLTKIVSTWILCPIIAIVFSMIFYKIFKFFTKKASTNLFMRHYYIRIGLIVVGAFGAYSLGANNIANVMGVFTKAVNFKPIEFWIFTISEIQVLFLAGALAISVGIFTYSKNVMMTVGNNLYDISPATALIVVFSSAMVLFVFSSMGLHDLLVSLNLPPIPLVPVSSSQAVVGSIIGIGLAKGDRNINFRKLRRIAMGWVLTPVAAMILAFVGLVLGDGSVTPL